VVLKEITGFIRELTGISPDHQEKVFLSLAVIAGLWVARRVALRVIARRVAEPRSRFVYQRAAGYLAVLLGLLLVGRIWFRGFSSLATFLGLASAGIAIALKEIIANVAGWFYIMLRRPFGLGDRIEVAGIRGDVVDIRVLGFSLLEVGNWVAADQSTGRIVHVPNGKVFSESIANYTSGTMHIWEEVAVLVTFESDWKAARRILEETASGVVEESPDLTGMRQGDDGRYLIYRGASSPIVYTSVEASGVLLTARFPVRPRQRRGAVEEFWEGVLDAFARRDDIDFAYPTTRYYDNAVEGKPGTRPEA
jgi:small-conductance mechanosensitive channel